MIETKPLPRTFSRYPEIVKIPNLVEIQTKAYRDFLQVETPQTERSTAGLESLLGEVFPIYSYDKTMCLEYVGYELSKPRYSIEECRQLRLTYGSRALGVSRVTLYNKMKKYGMLHMNAESATISNENAVIS